MAVLKGRRVSHRTFKAKEYEHCKAFWQWCCYQSLKDYTIKHVNEGKRHPITGRRLIEIGLQPGLPDYQILIQTQKFKGLWLEMKLPADRKKKQPASQVAWIGRLNRLGFYATFAYGIDDAIAITQAYLAGTL